MKRSCRMSGGEFQHLRQETPEFAFAHPGISAPKIKGHYIWSLAFSLVGEMAYKLS